MAVMIIKSLVLVALPLFAFGLGAFASSGAKYLAKSLGKTKVEGVVNLEKVPDKDFVNVDHEDMTFHYPSCKEIEWISDPEDRLREAYSIFIKDQGKCPSSLKIPLKIYIGISYRSDPNIDHVDANGEAIYEQSYEVNGFKAKHLVSVYDSCTEEKCSQIILRREMFLICHDQKIEFTIDEKNEADSLKRIKEKDFGYTKDELKVISSVKCSERVRKKDSKSN